MSCLSPTCSLLGNPPAPTGVLVIKSLDDLKERLGKVILLIMIVEVFKDAVKNSLNQPLDPLYIGASIGFIALGLYLC
jgi:uncharacterized membrane protein YqhA